MRRVLVCAGLLALALSACSQSGEAVDKEDWLAAAPAEPSASGAGRCDPDLVAWFEAQLEEGMTPEQVDAAVGPPDTITGDVWQWQLGACGLGVDNEWFDVTFKEDRLVDVRRVQG